MRMVILCFCLVLFAAPSGLAGQGNDTESLHTLLNRIGAAFESEDTEALSAVFPESAAVNTHALAIDQGWPRAFSGYDILRQSGGEAVVLIGGETVLPEAGIGPVVDAAPVSHAFSGLYAFERNGEGWRLSERLPFNFGHEILAHDMDVQVSPPRGMSVTDVIEMDVAHGDGIVFFLNAEANVEQVRLEGADPAWQQFGPLLLIKGVPEGRQSLTLSYSLSVVANDQSRNSAWFGEKSGHIRTQYAWAPSFYFRDPNGVADFRARFEIPPRLHLATDLRQTSRMEGDMRVIEARSTAPTVGFNIVYADDWVPVTVETEAGVTLKLYAPPDYQPVPEALAAEFTRVSNFLSERFGPAAIDHFRVIQSRHRGNGGWLSYENQTIMSAAKGGLFSREQYDSRFWFGHEVAHAWTDPSGPAGNFLSEGWARYVETLLVEAEYGEEAARRTLQASWASYFRNGYDGSVSLMNDISNSGISYRKGRWVFAMLEYVMGRDRLFTALRRFIQDKAGRGHTIEAFSDAVEREGGPDVRAFLMPWLHNASIPDIAVERTEAGLQLVQQQAGPFYPLTLDIAALNPDGAEIWRGQASFEGRSTMLAPPQDVMDRAGLFVVDPDRHYMLKRRTGDEVTVEIEAGTADSDVRLEHNFVGGHEGLAPVFEDGRWTFTAPLAAGTYGYFWEVDGKKYPPGFDSHYLEVQPRQDISGSY